MGTITKALEMLNLFSRTKPEIGLTEFVRLTGRDKATVHRHLAELELNGFLEQDPKTRAYHLGPAILRLSAVREATHPVRELIRPIVNRLADATGELVHASQLQGDQLSPIIHADPKRHGTQVHFDESELLPLHATSSGLSVLAFAAPEITQRVLGGPLPAFTQNTLTSPDNLRAQLAEIQKIGVAASDHTFDNEVASQGVAIFDASEHPFGALSVSVPTARATPDKSALIRPLLVEAAQAITKSLGGTYPLHHPLHQSTPTLVSA